MVIEQIGRLLTIQCVCGEIYMVSSLTVDEIVCPACDKREGLSLHSEEEELECLLN